MLQWAGLTAGWLLAAGLAALCALCWLGARAIKDKFYLAAVGFAGAALGLLIAGYAFGATGTDWPETIAWAGFVITFGSHLMLRNKAEGDSEDVRAFAPGDS